MEQLHGNSPRVIFVTGGPGTGKGTQCPKLVEEFGYKHISIGDLMRAEIKSGSDEGRSILSIVQSGGLVPKELTVSLLQKALSSITAHTVLVDGFPRSVDQAVYLEQVGIKVGYLLHFDTDQEDILLNRLVERGKTSGRADDNEEVIVKRFRIYKSESLPVLQLYEPFGIVRKVDCMGTINQVYFRTLCALRPEVLFVAGTKFSGKTTLSQYIGTRYYYYMLSLDRILKKTKNDDEMITRKLVQTLQLFKHEHRIIVDGFPQNANQVKLFTGLIGLPNKVIYLECPRDVCQERHLAVCKNTENYISSTALSELFSNSAKSCEEICNYYAGAIGKSFTKLDSAEIQTVKNKASAFIEPEVVLVRGNIRPCFLLNLQKQGFKLVNAVHLLELWRNARGLSLQENQSNLHDDPELIEVLKEMIFSGNATQKFVIYNFALYNLGLIHEFQSKICKFSRVFQLYSSNDCAFDNIASYFYPRKEFCMINSAEISYKRVLLPVDLKNIEKQIESQSPVSQSAFLVILGATLTGKSKIAKGLVDAGMRIIDFAAVIEDTKTRLSTEEDPVEELTFSEILDGIIFEAKKNPQQLIIIDGLPPSEVLFAKDPDFPIADIGEEKAEDEFAYDEDPSIQEKITITGQRMQIFLSKINVLSVIHLKVPYQDLEKRARKKFETPEEEELNPEQKAEIFKSWMIAQSLYVKPKPNKYFIPEVVAFNTEKVSTPMILHRLKYVFKRKCILLDWNCEAGQEIVKKMAWNHKIYYIDYEILVKESGKNPRSLDEKLELLKEKCKSIPPRSRFVVLDRFPFNVNEYETIIQELTFIEDYLGSLHICLSFTDREFDLNSEELIASPRKSEGHSQMWNNYKPASVFQLFHSYKGDLSEIDSKRIDYNNYQVVYDEVDKILDSEKRLFYQFILDENNSRGFNSYIADQGVAVCVDFKEKLLIDTSNLDLKKKIQSALKNPKARDFHAKYLKLYTVPFCLFFESFAEILKEEGFTVTSGLKRSIREAIDANKNSFIDAEEVNMFFETWESSEEREMIMNRGVSYDHKKNSDKLGYKLIVLVEESSPDPVTHCQSFNRGDTFEISFDGYPASPRFCADRTVYLGKENTQFKNDIEFNSADTRISISHMQIHSKKSGFYIVDNGSDSGVKLKVFEVPVQLFEDTLIFIGEHEIRVNVCTVVKVHEEDAVILAYRGRNLSFSSEAEIELEFLSEAFFGLKFATADKKVIRIGSAPGNDIVVHGINAFHSIIELKDAGWCIRDNFTTSGTLISINSYSNLKYKKPSMPLKLLHGMRFALPGFQFRVLQKKDSKINLDINSFQAFRTEKFSDFYVVVRKLGKSLLGEKFLCRHLQSKVYYMVKMILGKDINDNILNELMILRELDHPNMIKVVDTLVDGNKFYVVSEMCNGPELFEKIVSKGSQNEKFACCCIRETLQGLAYLHANNIMHRDIRPENLKFSDNSDEAVLKICDFANAIQDKGFVDKIAGTSHYLAPEVMTGKYLPASDIWSCGAVLYALFVGVPPFTGKTDLDVRKKVTRGQPEYKEKAWAGISNHGKRVIRSMLTFDPSKRPSAQDLLKDPWVKQSLKFLDISKPMIVRTFKSFKQFYSTNKLQQAIYMFMSQNLNNGQLKKSASDMFSHLDKDGDGKVSAAELLESMRENGMLLSENEVKNMLAEVDANDNGWVDFSEFLVVFTKNAMIQNKEQLESTFAMFDADGNGEISTGELKRILGQSESEWAVMIKEIDENKDGKIDIKEFKNLLCQAAQ